MNQTIVKEIELTPSQHKVLKANFRLREFIKDVSKKNVTTFIKPEGASAAMFHMQTNDLQSSITLIVGKRGKIDSIQVVSR